MHKLVNLLALNRVICKTLLLIALGSPVALSAQSALSDLEIENLVYMREEEKMARDLYREFYTLWRKNIFYNIAASEQRHMDAVLNLLSLYGIADPAAGQADGQFSNIQLQEEYDALLAQGSISLIEALAASIIVEENDINDLQDAIAATDEAPILRVYRNLLKGSLNHYSVFTNQLQLLDSGSAPGNSYGPGDGTTLFEPFSQSMYIPAIDVTSRKGKTVVYDGLFRIVEIIPLTLQLQNASLTSKIQNTIHARYRVTDDLLTIPRIAVGSLMIDSLEDTEYQATFRLTPDNGFGIFVLESLTPL